MNAALETVPEQAGTEMDIPRLRNQSDCAAAKILVEQMLKMVQNDDGHPLSGLLNVLLQSVSQFERQHYGLGQSDPKDSLSFLMEMGQLSADDLSEVVDAAELQAVLDGSRPFSMQLAMRLSHFFRVKPELFLK